MNIIHSPGEYNSRLHKQSPPSWTLRKISGLKPTPVGFACVDAVSNRQFNVKQENPTLKSKSTI
ncbi:MAG: hypothetical protein ACKPCI_09920 [Dolichospermum sp.]